MIQSSIFPKTPHDWWRISKVLGIFTLFAYSIIFGFKLYAGIPSNVHPLVGLLLTLEYTTIISITQLFTSELAHRLFPLSSRKAAIGHVIIQCGSAVVGFLTAQQVEFLILGHCNIPESVTWVIISVTCFLSLVGNGVYYLWYFYDATRRSQQAALQSELKALRAQINPHFLFNSLNSIAALIHINPDLAETMTEQLADLLRYSLRASKTPIISLQEELESVKLYLAIEKTRFGERLTTTMNIERGLENVALPSLLLQPLIENAVKHGVSKKEGDCYIDIDVHSVGKNIVIKIIDSGDGFDLSAPELLYRKGTGLGNVRDRLLLAFPESEFTIQKHGVVLVFPTVSIEKYLHTAAQTQFIPSGVAL